VVAEKTRHCLSLLIHANQHLTLSLTGGCSQHELLQHVAWLLAAVHNHKTFSYLSIVKVTGAELLMMSYFDLYNSAFRSVQSHASFVAEAGVKIFDPPNLTLTFQHHKYFKCQLFEEFAEHAKTHSLDTTEKLVDHLHAHKLVRFIHRAARHTDVAADAKTLYGATLDNIVENLALKPTPATTERFQPMFTSLLTKLKTHHVSGSISAAPVKSDPSLTKAALRQVSDEHHKRPERLLSRGGDSGSGGNVRAGGRGKGRGAKTTGPKFKPAKGTLGQKVLIVDKNTVCESCDSHGHFACDCPHRKSNAFAAQKKRDAAWAEKNKAQTHDLKEIDKLNKEIG